MTRTRLEILQWFALFGGPLAWATHHVVGYGLSEARCDVAGSQWHLDAVTWQIVLAALVGAVVLLAEAAALVVFRATRDVDGNAPGPEGRLHFFAEAALVGNVLFLVIVVLDVVGTTYYLPCGPS
jgi:hypothetical protein